MNLGILKYSDRKSLSPELHGYFMERLGIEGEFKTLSVPPDELEAFILRNREYSFDGFSVTTPHKEKIIQYLDELTPEAKAVGAVNTVAVRKGKLIGHNTDLIGFRKALNELDANIEEKEVLLFGAGGAARAVVYSLCEMNVSVIYVVNRTLEHAESLSDLIHDSAETELIIVKDIDSLSEEIKFVINALSYGVFQPELLSGLPNLELLYDLNYGANALDPSILNGSFRYSEGMSMLVHQGFESLKFWMQKDLPDDGLTDSFIESPPNFSNNASARVRATIDSPITAAAGTAHTSERS